MAKWTKVNCKIQGIKYIEVNELSGEYRVKLNYRYSYFNETSVIKKKMPDTCSGMNTYMW